MSRFSDYLQTSFDFSPAQAEEIILAMKKPIGKSIRVNTRKIALSDFKTHAKEQGWILTDTDIPEVFLIDRDDTTIALGRTLEHTAGWFYIQEVAAAHPPYLLKKYIANQPDKILDMCASPGGKTTQLADYFPESLVIANEVNRTRTPQLFDNLDRMGYDNVAVVSCDGRFFQNFPDFFDAVLLDAPCSGEGTAFRDSAIIDHWHEKNIDRIAKLQKQLMETAEAIVKTGGVVSYSTCTLNKEENEHVIYSLLWHDVSGTFDGKSTQNHWEEINSLSSSATEGQLSWRSNSISSQTLTSDNRKTEVQHWTFHIEHSTFWQLDCKYCKRFWPHIEHTGGFFASIFEKKSSSSTEHSYPVLAAQGQKNLIVTPATKGEREIVERFVAKHLKTKLKNGFLYLTKDGVYFNQRNLGPLAEYFFFVHAGARIGTIKKNTFTPTHHLFWCIEDTSSIPSLEMTPSLWSEVLAKRTATVSYGDGYYAVSYCGRDVGIGEVKKWEYLGI